jgi:hypothetical protein
LIPFPSFSILIITPFSRGRIKRVAVCKISESKVAEAGLNLALTPNKRKPESPGVTGHEGKKQKAHLAEPSGTEADKASKGSESVTSKGAKASNLKVKAAEVANTKAVKAAKTKAAKDAEAAAAEKAVKEKGKALVISKAPRQEAKEGPDVVMTQSPTVEEVMNESASFVAPAGDFEELQKQLTVVHKVCPLVDFGSQVGCAITSPRGSNRFEESGRAS